MTLYLLYPDETNGTLIGPDGEKYRFRRTSNPYNARPPVLLVSKADDSLPTSQDIPIAKQAAFDDLVARREVCNSIKTQADDAMANLRAYRDLTAPSNAQTIAAVRLLCQAKLKLKTN